MRMYIFSFREKGQVALLGYFNAQFGRSVEVDDVFTAVVEDCYVSFREKRQVALLGDFNA